MKTDRKTGGGGVVPVYRHPLLQKISFCLSGLHGLKDPAAKRPVRWTPLAAALAAVLMGVIASGSLAERCEDSLRCLAPDFTRRRRVGRTYNGLMKALGRQELTVLPRLKADLRRQALAALGRVPRTGGWTLLAVDGSKEALPRTKSHEQVFGIADNGKGPQAFVTAIVEVHTGLLWDWRVDRACASEKDHLLEMVEGLPERCLLLADGNFVGYRIWAKLDQNHKDFLIRVGGNVSLLTGLWPEARIERRGDIVYVWPKHQQSSVAPLRLRLIRVGPKSHPVYLLTNVLKRRRLRPKLAGEIYRQRWGVELFYRTFKRTLGYAKVGSRSARRARLELEWGLVTASIMTLVGIAALHRRGRDPRRLSPAGLARALRRCLRHGHPALGRQAARQLERGLGKSLRDDYGRESSKASRHRPVTSDTPKSLQLKPPKIRPATARERERAHAIRLPLAA